ncbi:rhomboid domain-containing protein 3 [Gastrophryne carolinensis]
MLIRLLGPGPTLGCCLLMLLLVFGDIMVTCVDVELHLETLQEVWDGHRLLTHMMCAPDKTFLVISLLLFPLLHWQSEQHVGTVYFLHLSSVCTLCNAAVYILISIILPLPVAASSGYLATQLTLLVAHGPSFSWRHRKKMPFLMSCGIITALQYLCPQSSFLYLFCGVITGLASVQESHDLFSDLPLTEVSTQSASPAHSQGAPVWYRDTETLEEEMLEAGILASLTDYKQHEEQRQEITITKSSVSALRLQQLERMGFPTGPAVVALAATGKVEGAVSLLVEGQVGGDIAVQTERQTIGGLQNRQL